MTSPQTIATQTVADLGGPGSVLVRQLWPAVRRRVDGRDGLTLGVEEGGRSTGTVHRRRLRTSLTTAFGSAGPLR